MSINKPEIKPFPQDWYKRFNDEELERLAIMTVDGGLSDEEAVKALMEQRVR